MIEINGLKKRFRAEKALRSGSDKIQDIRLRHGYFHSVENVSFCCAPGEVMALLGPNGAGKTTTLRMMATALKADAGRMHYGDIDVIKQPLEARKRIGFLSSDTGLYSRLTGRENIEYFGLLHGVDRNTIRQRIASLQEQLGLGGVLDKKCGSCSTGMRQKVAIARSVIHAPEILILDEPTNGLDIVSKSSTISFITSLKSLGVAVVFSTHNLDEVDNICDSVTVISAGVSKFSGSLAAFRALSTKGLDGSFLHVINQRDLRQCG